MVKQGGGTAINELFGSPIAEGACFLKISRIEGPLHDLRLEHWFLDFLILCLLILLAFQTISVISALLSTKA